MLDLVRTLKLEQRSVVRRRGREDSSPGVNRPTLIIGAMLIAAFGPYIAGSIRTEQAVVYGIMILSAPLLMSRFNPAGGLRFFVPWCLLIVVATLAVVFPFKSMPYPPGGLLAGYDNLLSPLAIMLIIWSLVPTEKAMSLLVLACRIVAIAMAINGLISVIATIVDLSGILRLFWGSASTVETVAERAMTLGRSTGIFNQPAEAGALYGLAGIAAVFAWTERPRILALIIPLIVAGGLFSVSKIFVIGGLPVIVFYWFFTAFKARRIAPFAGAIIITILLLESRILTEWSGLGYLQRLFNTDGQNLIGLYSAGRFDEGSAFFETIRAVLGVSPLAGVGATGWQIPYDGAIAEFLIIGGALGLGLVCCVYIGLLTLSNSRVVQPNLRIFVMMLFILTVGSSLGFSPLSANRVSTVSWILIALIVLCIRENSMSSSSSTGARVGRNTRSRS